MEKRDLRDKLNNIIKEEVQTVLSERFHNERQKNAIIENLV